jgi:hypothetical protein
MGYAMVAQSAFIAVQLSIVRMFFSAQEYYEPEYHEQDYGRVFDYSRVFRSALVGFLLGMGVLGLENILSSNRRYFVALWRPIAQTGRTLLYGSRHDSGRGRRS